MTESPQGNQSVLADAAGEVRRLQQVAITALSWLSSYPPNDPSGEWDEWWYMGDVTCLGHETHALNAWLNVTHDHRVAALVKAARRLRCNNCGKVADTPREDWFVKGGYTCACDPIRLALRAFDEPTDPDKEDSDDRR